MKYSAWSKDIDNLMNSSSGGIFYELAKKMIESGGKVVGVVMDGVKAKYVLTNNLDEIKKMRGSKYIPSNPSSVINEIKSSKLPTLVVGLPCHIKAVQKKCDTKNIILCSLLCHGLPKKGVFEKHIEKISKGRGIKSISFRDKKYGWLNSQRLNIVFTNGEEYDVDKSEDGYYRSYLNHSIFRDSCRLCKYNQKGVGDITIGDFWGVPSLLKNERGTSIVKINTTKGETFFNSIDNIIKKRVHFYHYLNVDSLKNMGGLKNIAYKLLKTVGLR